MLCSEHNLGLGKFDHDTELLLKAVDYLAAQSTHNTLHDHPKERFTMKNVNKWIAGVAVAALILAGLVAIPAIAQNFTSVAVADGSRSNPTLGFLADGTAGFYRAPGTGNVGVAGGIALPRVTSAQTPGSQGANTCAPQSFTVSGILVSDQVILVSFPATGNATGYGVAQVTAANTVAQTVCNPTAGALTPAAGTFTYLVIKAL